jgi:hypothetical protein
MDVLVMVTNPEGSASWSARERLSRWARVLEWHEYARELHAAGRLPWAWGLRQVTSSTRVSPVHHGVAAVYQVEDFAQLSALLDEDPLREVSAYLTVPLATLDEDFANDTERFDNAKRALIGSDEASVLAFAEYEAAMAKAPGYVGRYEPRMPDNPSVDFERLAEPGDPVEVLVYGVNPGSYIGVWDDLRHLMHYQKVLWWHHYTWMLATQGIKTHTWGAHDFCTAAPQQPSADFSKNSAAALDVFKLPRLEDFTTAFALDPIRDDTHYQVALLRPIAEQRRSDERRAQDAMRRSGTTIGWQPSRATATV